MAERLVGEIFRPLTFPIKLRSDNQSAIALARSEGQFHARSKHIDIRWHFIKFCVENESIELIYCPTEEMIADIFSRTWSSSGLRGSVGIQTVRLLFSTYSYVLVLPRLGVPLYIYCVSVFVYYCVQ